MGVIFKPEKCIPALDYRGWLITILDIFMK